VAAIEAVADQVVDEEVDQEVDQEMRARSPNAHTAKWTIIPLNHGGREVNPKTTETPAIQTPPGTTN